MNRGDRRRESKGAAVCNTEVEFGGITGLFGIFGVKRAPENPRGLRAKRTFAVRRRKPAWFPNYVGAKFHNVDFRLSLGRAGRGHTMGVLVLTG